jgi:serine protease
MMVWGSRWFRVLGILFFLTFALGSPAWCADTRVLIGWTEPGTAAQQLDALAERLGVPLRLIRPLGESASVVAVERTLAPQALEALLRTLRADPSVRDAQPDTLRQLRFVPNDFWYGAWPQWYLYEPVGMRAHEAWDLQRGSASVVIAVLDSGILPHADLDGGRILAGYDFISDLDIANDGDGRDPDATDPGDAVAAGECGPGEPAQDSTWHGLGITGVIAATTDNTIGVAGIDHGARILPVRVFGQCGALLSDILDAMRWAAGLSVPGVPDNPTPAQVLNLSFSASTACTLIEQQVVSEVIAAGAVVVAAAGNGDGVSGIGAGDADRESPGSCDGVITATALDRAGVLASYSKVGSAVDIAVATGDGADGVITLYNDGAVSAGSDDYRPYQGTSYSAAQVSGVVGLILAANPTLEPAAVAELIRDSAGPFPDGSCNGLICGAGLLDAAAAVAAAPGFSASSLNSTGGGGGGGGCTLGATGAALPAPWLALAIWAILRRRCGQR